ncbi:hypothetical protein [Methanovulcanius yangii]|uniref:hypothetical protein n=1 Tax=Methanovulcanius yangii TaxID=1789227 RepID=UPI0029C9B56A|nr:hypothetical protein [Methanovulcanius yangii]
MAKNTGKGHRKGAVKNASQFSNPKTGLHYKRDSKTGKIVGAKKSGGKFKGVRRE